MKRYTLVIVILLLQVSIFAQKKSILAPETQKVTATITISEKPFDKGSAGSNAEIVSGSNGKYLYQSMLTGASWISHIDEHLNAGSNTKIELAHGRTPLINRTVIYCKGNLYAIAFAYADGKITYYQTQLDGESFANKYEPKEILSFRSKELLPVARFGYNINNDLSIVMSPDSSKLLFINRPSKNQDVKTQTVFAVVDSQLNIVYAHALTDTTIKVSGFAVNDDGSSVLLCANKFTLSPMPFFGTNTSPASPYNYTNYSLISNGKGMPELSILSFTDNGQTQTVIPLVIEHKSIRNVKLFFTGIGAATLLYTYTDLADKEMHYFFTQNSEKGIGISRIDALGGKISETVSHDFTTEQLLAMLYDKLVKKNKGEMCGFEISYHFTSADGGETIMGNLPNVGYSTNAMAYHIGGNENKNWCIKIPNTGYDEFVAYKHEDTINVLYDHSSEELDKQDAKYRAYPLYLAIARISMDGQVERQSLLRWDEYGIGWAKYAGGNNFFLLSEGSPLVKVNKKISLLKLDFKK